MLQTMESKGVLDPEDLKEAKKGDHSHVVITRQAVNNLMTASRPFSRS